MARPLSPGAAVYCPHCHCQFGGMVWCPWDGALLRKLPNADPLATAFYEAVGALEASCCT